MTRIRYLCDLICRMCGAEFRGTHCRLYCSRECKAEAARLRGPRIFVEDGMHGQEVDDYLRLAAAAEVAPAWQRPLLRDELARRRAEVSK